MATDTPHPHVGDTELHALSALLATVPVAVYLPYTGRVYLCPNIFGPAHRCDREKSFTIPDAQLLAARIHAGELGPIPPESGPIVLAYGIPWAPS